MSKEVGKLANKKRVFSEEHRKNLSLSHMEKCCGELNPFYGKRHSEESKEKMRQAKLGKHHSEETKDKLRELSGGKNHPFYGLYGADHPCFGKKRSAESRQKTSAALTGRTFSEEHCKNISISRKGKHTEAEKYLNHGKGKNHIRWGAHLSEESKKAISEKNIGRLVGEKNPNWKGGISFGSYCMKFSREFKERVREFFGRKCVICGRTEAENHRKLHVHHVNYDKMSCCNDNIPLFVPLCNICHPKTNYNGRDKWTQYFDNLINTKYNGKCFYTKEEMISHAHPVP